MVQEKASDISMKPEEAPEALYVYGVAAAGQFETRGIGGSLVYTIALRDICALVHECPAQPYQSPDINVVGGWVRSHQEVLEKARESLNRVLPMRFNVIVSRRNGAAPAELVREWLAQDYALLKAEMEKIAGLNEYAVQVFYDPAVVGRRLAAEISAKLPATANSGGSAYMRRLSVERSLKAEMEKLGGELFKDFLKRIERHCRSVAVEKPKSASGNMVMLLNLSCLVSPDRVSCLGEELDAIERTDGFSVHFSGPWLPYSFVSQGMGGIRDAAGKSDPG